MIAKKVRRLKKEARLPSVFLVTTIPSGLVLFCLASIIFCKIGFEWIRRGLPNLLFFEEKVPNAEENDYESVLIFRTVCF